MDGPAETGEDDDVDEGECENVSGNDEGKLERSFSSWSSSWRFLLMSIFLCRWYRQCLVMI